MDKLTSRKFILAILSTISGIAISLTQLGGKVGIICAVISAIVPTVTYIITEGAIDAKAVRLAAGAVIDLTDIFEKAKEQDDEEQD